MVFKGAFSYHFRFSTLNIEIAALDLYKDLHLPTGSKLGYATASTVLSYSRNFPGISLSYGLTQILLLIARSDAGEAKTARKETIDPVNRGRT